MDGVVATWLVFPLTLVFVAHPVEGAVVTLPSCVSSVCAAGLCCLAGTGGQVDATEEQLAVAQAELGLTAIAVTLSDFSSVEIVAIRDTLRQSPLVPTLLTSRASVADLERQLAALKEAVQSPDSAQGTEQQQQISTALAAARAQVIAARTQLSAALRAAVSSTAWAMFDRVRAAPANLPASMRVLDWTEPELKTLGVALFEERKAGGNLSELSQADRDRILTARAHPLVSAAAARLTARLTEVGRALRGQAN